MAFTVKCAADIIRRDISNGCRQRCHAFQSSVSYSSWRIPLSEPLPSFSKPIFASSKNLSHETKVTTLSNGLKVASQNKFGQSCTVGVVIDAGSRYEVSYPSGISHFLEKLAFNSTVQFKDRNAVLGEFEKFGGICDCQGSRDTLIYAASANSKCLDPVLSLISETVLRPRFSEEEINRTRQTIQFELEDIEMRPEQDQLMGELIHKAAYNNNTLGLPRLCPRENVFEIDQKVLYTYLKNHFTPSRMVIAGVGIEHDGLVEASQKYFVEKTPVWEMEKLTLDQDIPVDNSLSQYTGGVVKVDKDMSRLSFGPTRMPELAHFMLALESCSHEDPDFIPFCVLNSMMGGGSSFSAGGPGKGMYTRLYTNVLNRHHWMYSASALNHAYSDSGIFCIHASTSPSQLRDLVEIIVSEFKNLAVQIPLNELDRAKKQLQSVLFMNLESRPVIFEDIGRQVLANGSRKEPEYFIQEIAKVTENDIHNISTKMLKTKASVAALGDLRQLPPLRMINDFLVSKEKLKTKRFSLFS